MICIHPGNYYLGFDTRTNELVRLESSSYIPTGCIRIIQFAYGITFREYIDPYKDKNLPLLKEKYWALPRRFVDYGEPDYFGE